MGGDTERPGLPSAQLRAAIRELLTANANYASLDPATRRALAQGLVSICSTALALSQESKATTRAEHPVPLARAQSAGSEFSGVAAQRVADTTRQILNAVSFPRFVTELINGVFKAMLDANQQQMDGYVELIRNVSASMDGFADANVGQSGARQWLAERFPASFVVAGDSEPDPFGEPGERPTPEEQAELDAQTRLRLRPAASMPSDGALRVALGLGPQDSVPAGDPENLVALARVALARNRQQMLATMVMLGMQRIVIESGRLHAAMRFHIDTRSVAQEDRASQFDARHSSTASGSFGYGPWGASATMTNTIGYVSTQQTQTTEEMNTDLDLNSSVELVFKTDYLPLDRLAGREQVDRIKVHTLNPEAELKAETQAREAREKRIGESEAKRWEARRASIAPPPQAPAAPKPGEAGSPEAATRARENAPQQPATNPTGGQVSGGKKPATTGSDAAATKSAKPPTSEVSKPAKAESGKPADRTKTDAGSVAPTKSTKSSGLAVGLDSTRPQTALASPRSPDVVFVPTPDEVIAEMLALAALKPGDLLYDLGCGDGRIVVTAAKKYGCRAVGFDIDPQRVAEARLNVKINHVEHLARIEQQDFFSLDLSRVDVVTMYLLPELNVRLIPQLERMKPGARMVSHDFDMAGIIPDRAVQIYLPRLYMLKTVFLWTAPLNRTIVPVRHEWSNSKRLLAPQKSVGYPKIAEPAVAGLGVSYGRGYQSASIH